jgi:hypothetical protein
MEHFNPSVFHQPFFSFSFLVYGADGSGNFPAQMTDSPTQSDQRTIHRFSRRVG